MGMSRKDPLVSSLVAEVAASTGTHQVAGNNG